MKKPIFYALVRTYHGAPNICAATSEKTHSWRGTRVYGRRVEAEEPTNWKKNDEEGRFNTLEEAQAAIGNLETALKGFQERKEQARETYNIAVREYNNERKRLIAEHSTYVGT